MLSWDALASGLQQCGKHADHDDSGLGRKFNELASSVRAVPTDRLNHCICLTKVSAHKQQNPYHGCLSDTELLRDIHGTEVTALPQSIGNCTKLQQLYVPLGILF
jgi:hypothetical protein